MKRKKKLTFEEFLRQVHNLSWEDYLSLNDYQKQALTLEYTGW